MAPGTGQFIFVSVSRLWGQGAGLNSAHGFCEAKTGTRVQCWHPGHVLEKMQKMQSKSGGEARSVEPAIGEVDAE